MDNGIDQRTQHHRTFCRSNTAGDSIQQYKIIQTIEKSAELPHMEHIARTAANHLIPTAYGIQ